MQSCIDVVLVSNTDACIGVEHVCPTPDTIKMKSVRGSLLLSIFFLFL
jgi:hypothetical protein